jgi:hypothetical protein
VSAGDPASRPRFRRRPAQEPVPADPEELFGELPRGRRGVGALWSHQADLLRTYAEHHQKTPDVALELPTGSGKTLVGLLIADWRRRKMRHRVVYACLTRQLARQVADAATDHGIPVVLLTGKSRAWSERELARYSSSQAVAITVYSHIFNTNSAFGDAQAVLFDDAHAAENYVAEAWALQIGHDHVAYAHLLDKVRDDLDPHLVARMAGESPDAARASGVWLLPVAVANRRMQGIDRVLATEVSGDAEYRFKMIRPGLRPCLFYLSPAGWYIRPMIPPTFDYAPFTDPEQRIYLSATIGQAGELERAFGRERIDRIGVPPAWERTGAGRRFFVFPGLAEPGNGVLGTAEGLIGELLGLAPKALILTPDDDSARRIADSLEIPGPERFTAKDPDAGLGPFIDADRGTLLAASRYDGMDLPGDACHLMLMSGLPQAINAQDQFLVATLRASSVLAERIRTRVVQGAGRCTRGPADHAVVIVDGDRLLRFLSREDVRAAMPVELQAEVAFGLENSTVPAADLVQLADSAIEQDTFWRDDAEPDLAERRRDARKTPPADAGQLAASAAREVRAWQAAWEQDWEAAARGAVEVFEHLTASDLRPYRSLWAYLASAWSELSAQGGTPGAGDRAASLLRKAHEAAYGTTWLREVQPLPLAGPAGDPSDDGAVDGVVAALTGLLASATVFDKKAAKLLAGLAQTSAPPYEQALAALGTLLGAESFKPAGQGRADAAWIWPRLWITIEAKTDQNAEGMLSMESVRQANTQLDSLSGDRSQGSPDASFSVIVSPREVVDPDAVMAARPHLYLARPDTVLALAHDVVGAWEDIRGAAAGTDGDARRTVVGQTLWQHGVLPAQIRDRLTRDPVRGR